MEIVLTSNWEYINAHNKSVGHCDDRLSDRGILDSIRLSKALKDEHFSFIFCSEIWFRRTTADLVFENLVDKNLQIIIDQNLREKDADLCPNLTREELLRGKVTTEQTEIVDRLFVKSSAVSYETSPIHETDDQVRVRCKKFLIYLIKHYPSDAKVLVVGNPIFNSYLLALLAGREWFEKDYLSSYCSLSNILYRDNMWRLSAINERQHLYGAD